MSTELLPAWVEVDLGAIVRNARALRAHAGVPILPMVKADAYGLGAAPVARALEAVDPWGYGVATIDEGVALRSVGIARPIIVFDPILPDEVSKAYAARLAPTLGGGTTIARWGTTTGNAPWHLAIDTGMSRAGIRWTDVGQLRAVIQQYPPVGACTHFYAADNDDASVVSQLTRFRGAVDALPERPQVLHAENTPAIERLAGPSAWSLVRPGVSLYGVGGRRPGSAIAIEPVASLHARIIDLHWIEAGEGVSYGATFRATERRRIATLAAGYADGYRRAFSNVGHALVHGKRVPVSGIVTMDMTMLDVTDVDCAIGDVATLLGADRSTIDVNGAPLANAGPRAGIDLAAAARGAGLCYYELLTGLRLRLPRVYLDAPRA